jgi:F1F0 ATPase subunit 2
MAMHELLLLAAAVAAGATLGAIFFGGLWLTVRKGVASQRPALWFFCSMLLRMSIALVGFFLVSGGRWERLLACLIGFVLARLIVIALTKSSGGDQSPVAEETGCAP